MGVIVKGWSDFLEIGANSTVGRVNFGAKKTHRHSERSEESPGRKRRRRGLRCKERDWGEKWQNGGYRYALNDNSTVSRVLFSRQK